jgi:DNA helicase-2/ATP-dependent DNA helicase PcrA
MAGLTTEQARAAAQYGPVLVLAGADTGKTKTLTAAVVLRIAAGGVAAGRVLAVTFTNKAATEMSSRIRAALDGGPAPSWLGTFHGLAARQLRIEPEVAGLRPGFDILMRRSGRDRPLSQPGGRGVRHRLRSHPPPRRRPRVG